MEQQTNKINLREVSEVQLIYKTAIKPSQRPVITSSYEAYEILLNLWNSDAMDFIEQFNVLLLNRSNRVLGVYLVSTGGITGTVADIRLILIAALKATAVSLILSHNHPSGSVMPSTADIQLTRKIKEAASFLDMMVYDHLIITSAGYFSFADEGLL
ncbi:MAG: repair protein [Bacteroidota bacterium]|nr:repair protein [Bacteroidota bacterium]